jgi:hypothetical protein
LIRGKGKIRGLQTICCSFVHGRSPSCRDDDKIISPFLHLLETFEKCSILVKVKEGEDFNHRNILNISSLAMILPYGIVKENLVHF